MKTPPEVALAELGQAINEADRLMALSADELIPMASKLPIETRLALAQTLLLSGIAGIIESLLAEELLDGDEPAPEAPPPDVEIKEDPMVRDEPGEISFLTPPPLPAPDVTVLLHVDELIAVCKNDTDAYPMASTVEVPAAWEELQRRAEQGDTVAQGYVAEVQAAHPDVDEHDEHPS